MRDTRKEIRVAAALAALLTSGCAITLNLPANRFDSPEARGRLGKGHVDPIGLQGSNTLVVVPDVTQVPPQTNPSWDRSNLSYRFSGGVGILDRLDLDLKLAFNSVGMAQAKYQIVGDPELAAKEGNLSVAATLGYGNSTVSGSASALGATGTYKVSFTALDAALIAGMRLSDSALLYGGPFFTSVSYSGKLDQSGAATASYDLKNAVSQAGANLGLRIGSEAVFLKLEEAFASASAPSAAQTGLYTGAQLGVRW